MSTLMRYACASVAATLLFAQIGCSTVNPQQLRQAQLRSMQLYQQNKQLAAERDQYNQMAQTLASERNQLQQQVANLQQDLSIADQRLDNYANESAELKQRYVSLLNQAKNQTNPLSESATRRFEELSRKYPEFEFDPQTGVSKFHSDILFSSGSDQIAERGRQLLTEFASIMNDGDAQRLNILIVGHTDDQRIAKPSTKAKHPTNWHLSTNRANSVALILGKAGVKEARMGVAGYSMYQPVVPNKDAASRAKNRRVEIFVLAPDAVVAGWDPLDTSTN